MSPISPSSPLAVSFLLLICISISSTSSSPVHESFLHCLSLHTSPSTDISQIVYLHGSPSYSSLLDSSSQNLRFASPATPKPLLIVLPTEELHIRASVVCCRNHGLQLRVRSGGHDYEGLSYRSVYKEIISFVLIYLSNLRSVSVDIENSVAWVDAGATLGDLYYKIAEKSLVHGFPAGTCPTVGVGGYISGGGMGTLSRKYGLAADNVLDAKLVDAKGRLLDRESMGEDLFWAIRGGGGASFGVIISWKLKLVPLPDTVSVLSIHKTKEQGAIELVHKFQYIAHKLHEDFFLKVDIVSKAKAVEADFTSFFLGGCDGLLHHLRRSFPELDLQADECKEMIWIQSTLYFGGYRNGEPLESLIDRNLYPKTFFKSKSDYLKEQIPLEGLEGIWTRLLQEGAHSVSIDPCAGRMDEILDSELPYPYRRGYSFILQYITQWKDGSNTSTSEKNLGWVRRMYTYMTPYVSKNPRATYYNFRDLDLGMNEEGDTSYSKAKIWGEKYFSNNFKRLALVKGEMDPENFFHHEQSIPPFHCCGKKDLMLTKDLHGKNNLSFRAM